MANSGSLLVLVAVVLVALAESGSTGEKLATCCTKVTNKQITEPILGYLVQKPNHPCVRAIIFQTESGLFCSQVNAPWVRRKIMAFERAQARSTASSVVSSSPVSLLSIITSTPSSPSSSTSFYSSTSKQPTGETLSETKNE